MRGGVTLLVFSEWSRRGKNQMCCKCVRLFQHGIKHIFIHIIIAYNITISNVSTHVFTMIFLFMCLNVTSNVNPHHPTANFLLSLNYHHSDIVIFKKRIFGSIVMEISHSSKNPEYVGRVRAFEVVYISEGLSKAGAFVGPTEPPNATS